MLAGLSAAEAQKYCRDCYNDYNYYEINKRYVIHDYSQCVSEYITKVKTVERIKKACYQNEPLRLAWTVKNYPNLRENPRRVKYWEGSYAKTLAVDVTYLRELVDRCRGRILSKNTFVETYEEEVRFQLVNPNLDPSISESFMLVPMTDEEAQQELAEAYQRCLKP